MAGFALGCNFVQTCTHPLDRRCPQGSGKVRGIRMTKLTQAAREGLPKGDFVFPKTRRYPIEDATHARDALARSSGKPEHAAVIAAVIRKFPEIDVEK